MISLKKKILLIISCLILLIASYKFIDVVDADSGWDSSYDSGSSWDSDSSWDSGSSWDSDSSWSSRGDYYSSGSYSSDDSIGYFIIIMIIFFIIVFILTNKNSKSHSAKRKVIMSKSSNYIDLNEDTIKKIDSTINKGQLKNETFDIYKNVQESWMNFDYDNLRNYTTDELYNMYNSQLKVLQAKKQQNIMKDIKYINSKIIDIKIENGIETVKLYLEVSQYDYVIDKDKKVVRGTDKYKNNVEYIVTFTRHIKDESISKCPNCGAGVNIVSGGVCPYCDSTIITRSNKFIMSKKECINQRRI